MAKRRKLPNGTGSIERVKKTVQGKTRLSQYRARLPAKYTKDGKKIQKDIGFFKTYNEALEALLNYKEPAKPVTFEQLYNQFKNTNRFNKLTQKTKNRYDNAFSKFESIHNTNIADITYTQLQAPLEEMEQEGYVKKINNELVKKDYSKDSIDRLRTVAKQVYTLAIKENIINYNLAAELEVGGLGVQREKEIFNKEEIETLFKSIPYNENAMHILILIFTGMRPGEYRLLEKPSIDLENNKIEDFGIKTETGKKRTMYIHPKIKPILEYLIKKSTTKYLVETESTKKAPVSDSYFNQNIYYPALDKANIPRRVPYSCRYTFATIAHFSGVKDKALQKLMGHKNFEVTANSYIQDLDQYVYEEFQKIE